jgi:hypothetical protein
MRKGFYHIHFQEFFETQNARCDWKENTQKLIGFFQKSTEVLAKIWLNFEIITNMVSYKTKNNNGEKAVAFDFFQIWQQAKDQ